jgi:hypothetical protein
MVVSRNRQYDEEVHVCRVLARRLIAIVAVIAIIALIPAMPPGATFQEDMSAGSMSLATGGNGPSDLSSHALACHMDFEHHQLVRSENSFVIPARVSTRVGYLTDVNSLLSREPAPLYRPPRV